MEGKAAGAGGAGFEIVAAVALRLLSITSAMWLRVELRVLVIMTGLTSLVLLLEDRVDLFGTLTFLTGITSASNGAH